MKNHLNDSAEFTYDDVSLSRVETLERRILALTRDSASTDGAVTALKTALSSTEVRLDTARGHADEATARFGDARTAAASVLGACRAAHAAERRAGEILKVVGKLLHAAHHAAESAMLAAASVDELTAETQSYGKNHYLPPALVDGVNQAESSVKGLVGAAIEAVQSAMGAHLEATVAHVSAEAVSRQAEEVWALLYEGLRSDQVRGVSRLSLGAAETAGWEHLSRTMRGPGSFGGLLNVLAEIQEVARREELELTGTVAQTRVELNTLEQRLSQQKSALRAAQLALDGARVVLGTQF